MELASEREGQKTAPKHKEKIIKRLCVNDRHQPHLSSEFPWTGTMKEPGRGLLLSLWAGPGHPMCHLRGTTSELGQLLKCPQGRPQGWHHLWKQGR